MEIVQEILMHPNGQYFLLVPVFSGLIGFATNFIGIQMMFKPLEFFGLKPVFGWQGIIPARAKKFAALQMDQVEKIIDVNEVLEKVNIDAIGDIMQPNLRQLIELVMVDLGARATEVYWENTPSFIKKRLYGKVEKELPGIISRLVEDIKGNHETLLDTKEMVVSKLDEDKGLLVRLVRKTIDKELGFLMKSGLFLGFAFGVIQMLVFFKYPDVWYVLPIGGFIVGYITNWIAVKLMFWPLYPIKIGPFRLQGVFIRRKDEVAKDYAETLTESVLNAETIANYILKSDPSSSLSKLLRFYINEAIDRSLGGTKHLVLFSVGTESFIKFKSNFYENLRNESMPPPLQAGISFAEKEINLSEIIESRMKLFTPSELDGFVRPIFEEDEWLLYMVGGALGFLAGWGQLVLIFS
ncbi:hypothetical protein A9Q99_11195 [Gammaproteobacteria bacterium 45_16_T64]|nr:hypothetical protein A9Q99_11195 [Gammaproteobacteria bacterium 45_16_T64]